MNWNVGICCAELYCPMCNYPLAPSGRFMVVPEGAAEPLPVGGVGPEKVVEATASVSDDVCLEVNTAVAICPKCGRPETAFKNKSGFVNHCRICGRGVKG
ncbi:MAG: hypothetical protein L7F78_05195 [Syntrophales bacterium LBB04]|nr:hypothetical protein [Syntrophales bacterium LBB04]